MLMRARPDGPKDFPLIGGSAPEEEVLRVNSMGPVGEGAGIEVRGVNHSTAVLLPSSFGKFGYPAGAIARAFPTPAPAAAGRGGAAVAAPPAAATAAGAAPHSSSSTAPPPGAERTDATSTSEYRIRFFNFNMANSSSYAHVGDLQGPGGRGAFVGTLCDPLSDGGAVDVVFTTLVETRLNLSEWVQDYVAHHRGSRLDNVLVQNARREAAGRTRSRVRGWFEGLAASYNGNLKSMLAFSGASFQEDPNGALFGRLTEAKVAGVPVPNPKKAFMGRSILERHPSGTGVRLCFVGAHFPIAKLAAALEDMAHDQLLGAKVALARSLRKVLRKACDRGVADERTVLFLQGDLNSRTVLRQEAMDNEFNVLLDRSKARKLGLLFAEPEVSSVPGHGHGGALLITGVSGGLAEAWNREHPQEQVRIGDCVVEVNGVRDDPARIFEECKQEKVLQMRLCRKVADVLQEVLRDDAMQVAIQNKLGLPPGRWHELADYESVQDLPVTYKFLENVACTSPVHSPASSPKAVRAACGGADTVPPPGLTIGDVMAACTGFSKFPTRSFQDLQAVEVEGSPSFRREAKEEGKTEASSLSGLELYRRHLSNIGDDKLLAFGLVYKKTDFRAFRFPASADRVLFWAPDAVADRLSFVLPAGGYEVNHKQLGSDHRPVALEVVVRIAPEGSAVRTTRSLKTSAKAAENPRVKMLLEQSDNDGEGHDSDDEHSMGDGESGEDSSPRTLGRQAIGASPSTRSDSVATSRVATGATTTSTFEGPPKIMSTPEGLARAVATGLLCNDTKPSAASERLDQAVKRLLFAKKRKSSV